MTLLKNMGPWPGIEGSTRVVPDTVFKIFAPMLKASLDSDGKMRLHGIASSTVLDRQGHEIRASALADMETSASNNMTIFLNHEYKVPEDVAGSVERASIRNHPSDPAIRDLVLDIVINEANPRAVNAWQAIQKGTQLGLSIGAQIPEGGAHRDKKSGAFIIEHVNLMETSLVGVPANPRSWVEYAVKSLNGGKEQESDTEKNDRLREPKPIPGELVVGEPIEQHELTGQDDGNPASKGKDVPVRDPKKDVEPDITKAPLSSEGRNALPDSAFACTSKRKYPHHTKSGAVDKAHLRNALARCGDSSNDQCGCAHIRAHAKSLGMGDSDKSMEELLVLALTDGIDEAHFTMEAEEGEEPVEGEEGWDVELAAKKPAGHTHPHAHEHNHEHQHWNGIKHSHDHAHTHSHEHDEGHEHVDDMQGSEHDHDHNDSYGDNEHPHEESTSKDVAPDMTGEALVEHLTAFAVPYNAPDDGDGAITASQEAPQSVPENEEEVTASDLTGQPEVAEVESALLALEPTVIASLRTSSDLLKAITRELITTKAALVEATEERDEAMKAAEKVVSNMAEILTKLSKAPVGRRAVVREVNDQFASLKSVYSEEFLNLLKKG